MFRPLDSAFDSFLVAAFIGLKVWLLFALPLTGDEAYWIWWSQHLGLGHYDHPPMVGWVLALLQLHSDELWWLRIAGLLTSVLISWSIYILLCVAEPSLVFRRRHLLVALGFFVSPVSLMFLMTANDTVLALFGFLGFAAYAAAVIRRSVFWALIAGLLLGAAVLSKYFAAFPILGLALFSLWQVGRIGWAIPLVTAMGVLPLSAINLYYNYTHCWNNILFNFFSRTRGGEWGLENPAIFLAILLIFIGPWSIWHWVRCGGRYTGILRTELGLLVKFASVPLLGILFLVSLRYPLSLQWPVLAIPMLWLLFRALPEAALTSILRWSAMSSLAVGAAIAIFLNDPGRWLSEPDRRALPLHTQTQSLCEKLPEGEFFTLGYSSQSILSVSCRNRDVHVFASRSKFGREDDFHVDFRALNGKEMQILLLQESDRAALEPFFESVVTTPIDLPGAGYVMATASGFRYEVYREQVLKAVVKDFYDAPYWFPQPGACPVRERYGL